MCETKYLHRVVMGRLGEEGKEECIIIQGGSLGSKCVGVSFSIHRALLQCMTTLFSGWTLVLWDQEYQTTCSMQISLTTNSQVLYIHGSRSSFTHKLLRAHNFVRNYNLH